VGNLKNKAYSIKFIIAVINSSLVNYYYRSLSGEEGRVMAQTDIETLEDLPIKEVSESDQKSYINIVDKIIAITKNQDYLTNSTKQSKVTEYERQIDQMVYKLYNLIPSEIDIVEEGLAG